MPGRTTPPPGSIGQYRYGMNGQMKDGDVFEGFMSADFWGYDSRLGRRWEQDPITKPWESPYATFNNNPIYFADPSGLDGEGPNGECPGDVQSCEDGSSEVFGDDNKWHDLGKGNNQVNVIGYQGGSKVWRDFVAGIDLYKARGAFSKAYLEEQLHGWYYKSRYGTDGNGRAAAPKEVEQAIENTANKAFLNALKASWAHSRGGSYYYNRALAVTEKHEGRMLVGEVQTIVLSAWALEIMPQIIAASLLKCDQVIVVQNQVRLVGGELEAVQIEIAATVIPEEAINTLKIVETTGVAPTGFVGGRTFMNYEGVLPATDASGNSIIYKEWDIFAKVKGINRGAQRLVTGSDGKAYYTADHYKTFTEIK